MESEIRETNNKNILQKLLLGDIWAAFLYILAFLPAKVMRLKSSPIWLICERKNHAEDNAWIFFNWLRKNHPEQKAFFVLKSSAQNFDAEDKNIIRWGSFRHYIYYLAADRWLMATFTTPMPNGRVCSYLDIFFHHKYKKVYLRHGISKDGMEEHCYAVHHFRLFICGAKPEYDYVLQAGGYPPENVRYTGFARFDDLYENKRQDPFILIIPTWRKYIGVDFFKSDRENDDAFLQSDFYRNYMSLIENQELLSFLSDNHLKARFCLHAEYRKFAKFFDFSFPYIDLVGEGESIHDLITRTCLLITDYSSVFFDAAYAGKPVIHYHFDYEEFRRNHLKEGYFSYENDGLGPIAHSQEELVSLITTSWNGNAFELDGRYAKRAERFFPLRDAHNCERIYAEIMKI